MDVWNFIKLYAYRESIATQQNNRKFIAETGKMPTSQKILYKILGEKCNV